MQHNLYVHRGYRLFTWCGANIHHVSSLYSHRLHRLGCMSGATPLHIKSYSTDCSVVAICKNYPPIHQIDRKSRYTGRLNMVYSSPTIHHTIHHEYLLKNSIWILNSCPCDSSVRRYSLQSRYRKAGR